jgi:hypothetical protein
MTTYMMCPKPALPSGGCWFIHRLVGLLNEMGHDAKVWTPQPFIVTWDAHPIDPSLVVQSIQPGRGDTVIIPEVNWPVADMNGARQILFVQNYLWLDKYVFDSNPGDTLVCSRFLANHMQRVFNANVIGKITPFLDDDVWFPSPKLANRVLLVARRRPDLSAMLRSQLESNGFEVDYVTEPMTQIELSGHFRDAEFYVHTVYPEGFPMICLEAMRSGTIAVGTTGGGGNEFMMNNETAVCVQDPENGRYFNESEFVTRIIEQLLILRGDADKRSRIWTQAHQWSLRYVAEETKKELKAVFG